MRCFTYADPVVSFRSVFRDNHGALDRESRFSPLFKQESNKISVDDLMKLVSEYRRWSLSKFLKFGRTPLSICISYVCRAEKTSKLQTIPGTLDIAVDYVPMEHPSASELCCLSSAFFFCDSYSHGFSSSRLRHLFLHTSEALWRPEQTPANRGGGGVRPGLHQVHAAAPRLQEPHLRLPQTP